MQKIKLSICIAAAGTIVSSIFYLNSYKFGVEAAEPGMLGSINARPIENILASPPALCNISPTSLPSVADLDPNVIKEKALLIAKNNGNDPLPSSVEYVKTTRKNAVCLTVDSAAVDSDQPVYLVVMKGSFIGYKAFAPNPGALPKGSTITFTMDANTKEVLDFTLNDFSYELKLLGVPKKLTL